MTVEAGKTYRLRVINTGSLVYQVCCLSRGSVLRCEVFLRFFAWALCACV